MTQDLAVLDADRGIPAPRLSMDLLVGYVLQAGVLLSAALLIGGLLWRWYVTGRLGVDYPLAGENLFRFAALDMRAMMAGRFRPRLLINTGVIVLLFTPFVRVAVSVAYFLLAERNLKYTVFTSFVLAVLTYSLFLR
jgi:uncharacterized membrane protein